jgi:hypothetical protein
MPWPCCGPPLQRPEDQHVERALEQFKAVGVALFTHSRRQSTAIDVGCLRLVPRADGLVAIAVEVAVTVYY